MVRVRKVVRSLSRRSEEIAAETLDAAEAGLLRSIDDPGLRFTFYLLTQIVLAAREPNWQGSLAGLGIHISDESSLYDLTSEVQIAVDDHLSRHGGSTDVSEMAQKARERRSHGSPARRPTPCLEPAATRFKTPLGISRRRPGLPDWANASSAASWPGSSTST